MADVVNQNMEMAQSAQKAWYDKKARRRDFETGEQVLVTPTSTSKLLAKWQGPFSIVKKIGVVNYQVDIPNRKK